MRSNFRLLATAAAVALVSSSALAQAFPTKPIKAWCRLLPVAPPTRLAVPLLKKCRKPWVSPS